MNYIIIIYAMSVITILTFVLHIDKKALDLNIEVAISYVDDIIYVFCNVRLISRQRPQKSANSCYVSLKSFRRLRHQGKYNRPVSRPVLALITSISRADRRLNLERLFHILGLFAHSRTLAFSLSGKKCDKETNKCAVGCVKTKSAMISP